MRVCWRSQCVFEGSKRIPDLADVGLWWDSFNIYLLGMIVLFLGGRLKTDQSYAQVAGLLWNAWIVRPVQQPPLQGGSVPGFDQPRAGSPVRSWFRDYSLCGASVLWVC